MTRPSVLRLIVDILDISHPFLAGDLEDGFQPVGCGLVRAEDPEIAFAEIELHHVAQEIGPRPASLPRERVPGAAIFDAHSRGNAASQAAAEESPPLACGLAAHAALSGGRELREFVAELAVCVEEFLGLVAPHPVFELPQMLGVLEVRDRHLMRAPGALDGLAVDDFRSGPAFRRAEDDHRPARASHVLRVAGARFRSGSRGFFRSMVSSVAASCLMH